MSISRRDFLKLGFLGSAVVTTGTTYAIGTNQLAEKVETTVKIPNLPKAFDGYKIAFIADIHLGVYLSSEMLDYAINLAKGSEPDLFLLGGDYIWIQRTTLASSIAQLKNREFEGYPYGKRIKVIFETCADLVSQVNAPDGTFAIYGNHDRWEDPLSCKDSFVSKKIELLNNKVVTVTRADSTLELLGTDDYWTGAPTTAGLTDQIDRNTLRVVLSHNPDYVSYLIHKTPFYFHLALCGHTHGGQVQIPGYGPIVSNIRDLRLTEGLYLSEKGNVYTTRGIGTVELPIRIACPPEVSIITLST
ncbi:MAG: metallophosphoesterase [Deltaproteobacteria bacterium]|nr:metallophosphoesterase [Deltaproteobacteria bacterium]